MFLLIAASVAVLLLLVPSDANLRLNQKIYVPAKAINLVDPMKHGFRIILNEQFIKDQLSPTLLPMVYVTAIPMAKDEVPLVKMFYPESIYEDKQVNIADLRESSWYVVCIEWENYSRHNETTGSECRLLRTLDRTGKSANSTIDDLAEPDSDSQTVYFRLKTTANFPLRITLTLKGGAASPAAQTFYVNEPSDLEGSFPNLRQYTDYGRLCIVEEPQVTGYTAMGRLASGLTLSKCHFSAITTKDYELSTFDSEASAYRGGIPPSSTSVALLILLVPLLLRW